MNRTDTWAQYVPPRHGMKEAETASIDDATLTIDTIARHYQGYQPIRLHCRSEGNTSRWFAIEWNAPAEADDLPAEASLRAGVTLHARLNALGLEPILEDANGKGKYRLIVVFRKPAPAGKVHALVHQLMANHTVPGLTEASAILPTLEDARRRENDFLRLPGYHRTEDHWSRIWRDDQWLDGEAAVEALLSARGVPLDLIPDPKRPPSNETSNGADGSR